MMGKWLSRSSPAAQRGRLVSQDLDEYGVPIKDEFWVGPRFERTPIMYGCVMGGAKIWPQTNDCLVEPRFGPRPIEYVVLLTVFRQA